MKKYVLLIIVAVMVFGLAGCGSLDYPKGNVTAEVKEGSLTNTQLTLVLTNDTDREYTTGLSFRIERRTWRGWVEPEIPWGTVWRLPGIIIPPNSEIELVRNFANVYGELPPGRYRIVKGYSYWRAPGDTDQFEVYAEFVIE